VFRTLDELGNPTIWVVVDCDPGRRIRYARTAEGVSAGTVTVTLSDSSDGCAVLVAYDLTATHSAGAHLLEQFDADYDATIASWRTAITGYLDAGGTLPPEPGAASSTRQDS